MGCYSLLIGKEARRRQSPSTRRKGLLTFNPRPRPTSKNTLLPPPDRNGVIPGSYGEPLPQLPFPLASRSNLRGASSHSVGRLAGLDSEFKDFEPFGLKWPGLV